MTRMKNVPKIGMVILYIMHEPSVGVVEPEAPIIVLEICNTILIGKRIRSLPLEDFRMV